MTERVVLLAKVCQKQNKKHTHRKSASFCLYLITPSCLMYHQEYVCFHINQTWWQEICSTVVDGVKMFALLCLEREPFHAPLLSGSCCHLTVRWGQITTVLSRLFSLRNWCLYLSVPRTPTSSHFPLKYAERLNHHTVPNPKPLYPSLILLCNVSHFTFPHVKLNM